MAALLLLPAAAGAADVAAPADAGLGTAWALAFVLLAVLAAAAAAVAGWKYGRDGRERLRQDDEAVLRDLRAELRDARALQRGWAWQTDAAHALVAWQLPAGSPSDTPAATLPGALTDDPALRYALKLQQAFAEVRARGPGGGWRLSGQPRFDAQGRFAGFAGLAEPTAQEDAGTAAALGLAQLLAAQDHPVVLAETGVAPEPAGWLLRRMNPAAAALLPGAAPGQPLAGWLERLAAPSAALPLAEALLDLARPEAAPGPLQAAGWRVQRYGPLPDGRAGLLLQRSGAAAADTGSAEGEQFSFTLSHDLRAPIRVVEGFTRIVKEDYGRQLDRVGNDHLDRVLGAAARMNQMIDALLTLAKLSQQPLARQPVNLSQLATYVVDELRRHAPERVAEVQVEPELSAVGDPTLLRLVLENLLGNAWKYTGRCARTQISFTREDHGGRPAFVVRDNGAGFDMRSADRLFGLFQRLHSANDFPGTGVGLASVRRIVRRHQGEIWAEAEPGRGAAFHFTLGS